MFKDHFKAAYVQNHRLQLDEELSLFAIMSHFHIRALNFVK
jgi:hypothetical protein